MTIWLLAVWSSITGLFAYLRWWINCLVTMAQLTPQGQFVMTRLLERLTHQTVGTFHATVQIDEAAILLSVAAAMQRRLTDPASHVVPDTAPTSDLRCWEQWWMNFVAHVAQLSAQGKLAMVRIAEALTTCSNGALHATVGADWHEDAKRATLSPAEYQADAEAILLSVAEALQHPMFGAAHAAVRTTATTLGFNDPQSWVKLSRHLKQHGPGWADNAWRHLNACHLAELTSQSQGRRLTNPERHLLVQLAYAGFAKRGH